MSEQIGHCKHGEFILTAGCQKCIAEWQGTTGDAPFSVGSTTAPPITEAVLLDEPQTVLVKVNPSTDPEVISFYNEALRLQQYAQLRVITTVEDLKPATDDLSIIARVEKWMENRRKEYLKPFQDHIKETNDAFKTLMEPIEQADAVTRQKILAFQLKQKLIREEQERINALRLEAAQLEASRNGGVITESVNLVEVSPEAPRRTETNMGMTGTVKIKKWEVEDLSKVPLDYLMIDAAKVGKVVRAGIPNINGIRIWEETILKVTAR